MRNLSNLGDAGDLRSAREARKNPPDFDPGQSDDLDWAFFDDKTSGSSMMDDSAFSGSTGSNSMLFNNNDLSMLGGSSNSKQDLAKSLTADEDKIIDALIQGGKLFFGWSKILFDTINKGFQESNAFFWASYSSLVMRISLITTVVGIIMLILGLFSGLFVGGFWTIIGGLISLLIGLLIFIFSHDIAERESYDSQQNDQAGYFSKQPSIEEPEEDLIMDWGLDVSDEPEEASFNWGEDLFEEEPSSFDLWGDIDRIAEELEVEENYPSYEAEAVDIESAIGEIRDIPAHTQTRQYLFEEFSRVLPIVTPDFANMRQIPEDSDNFVIFDKLLYDAAVQNDTKEDKIPELVELRENSFIIQLKATRPSNIKEEKIANEIAKIYSMNEYGGVEYEGVYAVTSSVGSNFIINIFKGENALVTLADAYKSCKDYVLDTKVGKPIIAGIDELGKVWKYDANRVFSFIISGKPRSGKSWAVVSLVMQLCMYSSPKEVNFEVFDVKGTGSDYYAMNTNLPHFKHFVSDPNKIISRLRYITTTEAERRKKILKENGCIAIADLKKKDPNVDMPYLYLIIDEIIGLTEALDKEGAKDFKGLVNNLITQMPNLGIRLILVPHRVTNDVVPKTTYVNVGYMACVKTDSGELSNVLDVSKKDFPYDLVNDGDMAVKCGEINRGKPVFCHSVPVTTSNEDNEALYKFVGALWNKLEPDDSGNLSSNVVREEYKGHNIESSSQAVISVEEDLEETSFWDTVLGDID